MHYAATLIGIAICIVFASFLSGAGAFVTWIIITATFLAACYSLESYGKESILSFLGVIWLTLTIGFIVCAFFVWGLAGDLSWMLKQ